jgi:hypothetical protein
MRLRERFARWVLDGIPPAATEPTPDPDPSFAVSLLDGRAQYSIQGSDAVVVGQLSIHRGATATSQGKNDQTLPATPTADVTKPAITQAVAAPAETVSLDRSLLGRVPVLGLGVRMSTRRGSTRG